MFTNFWNRYVLPISLLSGTIIGAGIFSLPYVFSTTGILVASACAVLFCAVSVCIYYIYGDLLLKFPSRRYVGIMESYFGKKGYFLSFIIAIVQLFITLTIYIVLSSTFLSLVFPSIPPFAGAICFWILSSTMLFVKLKKEALGEFVATFGIVCSIGLICVLGLKNFFVSGTPLTNFSWTYILLPFGSLLFAFNGRSVIPELVSFHKGNRARVYTSVVWGTCIPLVLYVLFVMGVIGLSPLVTADALTGLAGYVSPFVLSVLGVLGLLALWSSYVGICTDIHKTLISDMHTKEWMSLLLVILIPIGLYIGGMKSFFGMTVLTGGILTALDWILLVVAWKKHSKISSDTQSLIPFSSFLYWFLLCVLCIGLLYTLTLFSFGR